jgi:hypothetical protein
MTLLQTLKLPSLPKKAPQAAASGAAASAGKIAKLSQAAESWRQSHGKASERIAALKKSVQAHYADGHPDLLKDIDDGLAKLDAILDTVDHRLADSLASAGKTGDDAARKAELKNAKSLLTEYITYVKSEPLIAHIDGNPFGVKTDLRALLAGALTDAAKAMS